MVTVTSILTKQNIRHDYQPLFELKDLKVYGFEAFIRHQTYENPLELFKIAREEETLYDVDKLSIKKAIERYIVDQNLPLFLNIFPSTLTNERFRLMIQEISESRIFKEQNLIFELNETKFEESVWEQNIFHERIQLLRRKGIKIAIDDVSKGTTTFYKLIEFSPEYIKLDRYFAKDLNDSHEKQKLISSILESFHDTVIVLEGIEKIEELEVARALGVTVGQGYLLGKPGQLPIPQMEKS